MSPAITDGERFGGFHVCQIRLSDSASWSFCLIGVLIGVVRVIFCAPRYLPFSSYREQNIARSRGRHSNYCNPRQLQRVRCSACSRLQF